MLLVRVNFILSSSRLVFFSFVVVLFVPLSRAFDHAAAAASIGTSTTTTFCVGCDVHEPRIDHALPVQFLLLFEFALLVGEPFAFRFQLGFLRLLLGFLRRFFRFGFSFGLCGRLFFPAQALVFFPLQGLLRLFFLAPDLLLLFDLLRHGRDFLAFLSLLLLLLLLRRGGCCFGFQLSLHFHSGFCFFGSCFFLFFGALLLRGRHASVRVLPTTRLCHFLRVVLSRRLLRLNLFLRRTVVVVGVNVNVVVGGFGFLGRGFELLFGALLLAGSHAGERVAHCRRGFLLRFFKLL